jgi:5-methylcytosine-specific restriction endonuclease McrA
MARPRKSLKTPREKAFKAQGGRCYYCNNEMWLDSLEELAHRKGCTPKQARWLKCTGEHLIPHSEGGSASQKNIVAACHFCNQRRHDGRKANSVAAYIARIRKLMRAGRWHVV